MVLWCDGRCMDHWQGSQGKHQLLPITPPPFKTVTRLLESTSLASQPLCSHGREGTGGAGESSFAFWFWELAVPSPDRSHLVLIYPSFHATTLTALRAHRASLSLPWPYLGKERRTEISQARSRSIDYVRLVHASGRLKGGGNLPETRCSAVRTHIGLAALAAYTKSRRPLVLSRSSMA